LQRPILSPISQLSPKQKLKGQIYLGSETFIEEHAHGTKKHTEIPLAQLPGGRSFLQQIVGKRGKKDIEVA
jgi:hypothetical protein